MFEKRVGRFRAVTRCPGLLHKNILQIDIYLEETHLINDSQNLFAKGTVKRRICYFGSGSGIKKIDDQIQFVISMGEPVDSPLSTLQTELIQDYYIFQPVPIDTNEAVLEQGFILNVKTKEPPLKNFSKTNKLQVDSIVKQGKDSTLIQVPFQPEFSGGTIESFRGSIHFGDFDHLPVVMGQIQGTVYQKNWMNSIQESLIQEKVGVFVNIPVLGEAEKLIIAGDIHFLDWQVTEAVPVGTITLQLNYRWHITKPKELSCIEPVSGGNFDQEQIETLLLIDKQSFHFFNTQQVEIFSLDILNEIKLEQFTYKNSFTQNGILFHADLILGICFINSSGVEQYQEHRDSIDELFPVSFLPSLIIKPVLEADFQSEVAEYCLRGTNLKIILDCRLLYKFYEKKIITVVKDESATNIIYGKTMIGEKAYSFYNTAKFTLQYNPFKIIEATGRLIEISGEAQSGRVAIKGSLEMNVTYLDQQKKIHQDFWQSVFKDFYIWDSLQPEMVVELESNLEYNRHQSQGSELEFLYLIHISMKAFHSKVIRIQTGADHVEMIPQSLLDLQENSTFQDLLGDVVMDWDLPVSKGNIQEIAKSQIYISQFDYQDSQNALLIKGNLSGELEYWDQRQYLQKLTLDLPFWRFVPNDNLLQTERRKLSPMIRSCSYSPFLTKPWRKGGLKIHLELGIT